MQHLQQVPALEHRSKQTHDGASCDYIAEACHELSVLVGEISTVRNKCQYPFWHENTLTSAATAVTATELTKVLL